MKNMTAVKKESVVWRQTPKMWISLLLASILTLVIFSRGLNELVRIWGVKEEYSYGYLIPFITAFLIWQKKELLERISFHGSWTGLALILLGIAIFIIGELSTLYIIVQYSFVIVFAGLVLAFVGWKGFKHILVPLLVLAFMIPLPEFLLKTLSAKLQLLSSQIGVWVIKLFGISVFLEGNVIDLGTMKLQVVEACSGLRYLFPLMTFGFITAYFYKTALWKKALIFFSTIPITIFMNSLRIGIIGVTVEYWGKEMAEGFIHDFEGWIVFMACTAVLFLEMWILTKLGHDKRSLRTVFGLDFPAPTPKDANIQYRAWPKPFIIAAIVLGLVAILTVSMPERDELIPKRNDFANFPMNINEWKGTNDRLEQIVVNTLKFDDYILANYSVGNKKPINLYVAYYSSQRSGQSAHSPRTCIPGGGWEITSLTQPLIDGAKVNGKDLYVDRAVIELGENRQLVYYWFQQRGRIITNEYLVKWYLFWDSLIKNRTDGALVRVTTSLKPGQELKEADEVLKKFLAVVVPELNKYIPN